MRITPGVPGDQLASAVRVEAADIGLVVAGQAALVKYGFEADMALERDYPTAGV